MSTPSPNPAQSRAEIVAWARDLVEDLTLKAVRGWLDAAPGRHACGCLPVYVPKEVVYAAGMLPVGLHGGGSMEIIRGDAFYQSYICHLPRSIIELGQSGRLDALSALLFPSTCDVIRNLSGMWKVLAPDRYVRYVDLPQVNHPERAREFWVGELRVLLHDLSAITGRKVTDDHVWEAIAVYAAQRRLLAELYTLRRDEPWRVPTEELYLLMRAGELCPLEVWTPQAEAYLAAARADLARPRDNARVVLVGAFCEQPPLGLIRTLERSGCYIVDDDLLLGNRLIEGEPPVGSDPVEVLAQALLTQHRKTSILYEPDPAGKACQVPNLTAAARADGVIFAAPSFCDPALLDRPMLRAGAEAAGIPCIAFEYSENTGQYQQYREQAGTFSDTLKLWVGADGGAAGQAPPGKAPAARGPRSPGGAA